MTRINWTSSKIIMAASGLLLALFLISPITAMAETPSTDVSAPPASSSLSIIKSGGPCNFEGSETPSLDCVLYTLGNIAQIILALTGSLALLMFVYGGFLMLSSGGSSDKVNKGKQVLTSAVIGIVIILCAGYLIRYGMEQLQVQEEFTSVPQTETETKAD